MFSIYSHKLGRTNMEIGSIGKGGHIEKGFYGGPWMKKSLFTV